MRRLEQTLPEGKEPSRAQPPLGRLEEGGREGEKREEGRVEGRKRGRARGGGGGERRPDGEEKGEGGEEKGEGGEVGGDRSLLGEVSSLSWAHSGVSGRAQPGSQLRIVWLQPMGSGGLSVPGQRTCRGAPGGVSAGFQEQPWQNAGLSPTADKPECG